MKKKTLFIFTFILLFLSCNRNKHESEISNNGKFYPEVESRSVIIGQITNITGFSDASRVIELAVDDITIDHQHSFETEIDDSGKFMFDIPLYHPINSYMNYGDARITPYLFPNDTLYVKCQIGKKGFKIGIVSGEFDEKHNQFENEFFNQYHWIHYNQINWFRDKLSKDLTLQELKTQYLDFEKLLLENIENRIVNDSLNDTLADYLRYSAKYSIYRDIIRLDREFKIDDKQEFFSFLKDSIVFSTKAMVTGDYQSFLNAYRFHVEPRQSVSVISDGKTKEQVRYELVRKSLEKNSELRRGVWAEFLNASEIYGLAFREEELTPTLISKYSEMIKEEFTDPYIRQLLLSMCDKTSQKVKEIANLTIPVEAELSRHDSLSGEVLFDKILNENKDKVIYIDIWATWCSPCKQQISHSLRMHEMLKDKDVSFMYFCCSSEQQTWKNVIKQYQMKGNHILLNDDQYEYLKNRFLISGIPRYILIDKNGEIINPDAPRPDSEKILEQINELTK